MEPPDKVSPFNELAREWRMYARCNSRRTGWVMS